MSSENVPTFWLVNDYDEVAMYHQHTYWPQQTIKQAKVIQEVLSPEVSKVNNVVMNKKQGDQMQFSPEKRLEKRKWIHHSSFVSSSYQPMDCVIKWGN